MSSDRRASLGVHAGLAATVLVLFSPILLGQSWYTRDALAMHQVWRGWAMDQLAAGVWPEWFDGIGMGVPAAANPLFGATYPVTWLLLPLPTGLAIDLLFVLHVLLAGIGMARLARRFGADPLGQYVAGAVLMASGWLMGLAIMGIPLLTLAWTPHIACAALDLGQAPRGRRLRPGLGLAALIGLQLTAGDPAAVITGALFTLIVLAATVRPLWPALLRVAAAGAAAVPLAALMLLPALGFMADSERASGLSTQSASTWSMHPLRVAEWIWPGVYGDPGHQLAHLSRLFADTGGDALLEPAFGIGMYVSLPVLLLVGVAVARGTAPLRRVVLGATLFFLVLALGRYTPLYGLFRAVFLPEQLVRYPERHFGGVMLAWSLGAGIGFTWVRAHAPTRRAFVVSGAAVAVLAVAVGALWLLRAPVVLRLGDLAPAFPPPVNPNLGVDIALAGGFAAVLTGLLVLGTLVLRGRPATAALAPRLGALVIVGHLVVSHIGFLPALEREHLRTIPAWVEEPLAEDRGAPARGEPKARVFRDEVLANVKLKLDIDEVEVLNVESLGGHTIPFFALTEMPGYHTVTTSEIERVWSTTHDDAFERMLDLFDVRWALLPKDDSRAGALPLVARGIGGYGLHENLSRRPRAFVAPRWQWLPDAQAILKVLLSRDLDFHAVRLEGQDAGERPGPEAAGQTITPCALRRPRPERMSMTCDAATAGWLVVLESAQRGWQARVDGVPTRLVPAEAIAMALPLPAGPHTVELVYATPGLRRGLAVSAAAWAIWAALLAWSRRRGRGAGDQPPRPVIAAKP